MEGSHNLFVSQIRPDPRTELQGRDRSKVKQTNLLMNFGTVLESKTKNQSKQAVRLEAPGKLKTSEKAQVKILKAIHMKFSRSTNYDLANNNCKLTDIYMLIISKLATGV